MILLGCSQVKLQTVHAVLDTGAGPNLVREELLPKEWRRYAPKITKLPRIRDANNRRLTVEGILPMVIDLGGQRLHASFLVCKDLAVPAILGCAFIQRFVEAILPQENKVVLKYGGAVAIQSRKQKTVASINAPDTVADHPCPWKKRDMLRAGRIKLTRSVVIPPYSEAPIYVRCARTGILQVTPAERLMCKLKVSVPHGIIDAPYEASFVMKIANFSKKKVRLRKGVIVGLAEERPKFVICPLQREGPPAANSRAPSHEPWIGDVNLDHLGANLRDKVVALLRKYASVCDGTLGTIKGASHRIEIVPGAKPIYQQPYRCGIERRKAEEAEVQRMLQARVITPSNAEWASPVILVPKPDGSLRFCVDYRKLNSITVRDSYPMPRMDECIDSLGSATVFSTLDCNSGYWQLPVAKEDQDKTTFTCHAGSYKFLRLPFGLRNAPATFQRAMDIILSKVRWKYVLVYLDDIIVFSDSDQKHLRHLENVLKMLREAGATLRLSKCDFFKREVKYLGHIVRPGKLAIYGKNLEAITKVLHPKNKTQMRSFLGMCNVYRRFVKGYTRIARPLTLKTCKDQPESWDTLSDEEAQAFKQLKRNLVTAPILALPREGFAYTLDTDASEYQLGCCLLQEQPDGALHPIGYWSRSLTAAEKNYSSTEKECLAIVWAVQHLRPYLEGAKFTIRTDHDALKWLLNLRDPRGRLARWSLRLQEYDYDIVYKPGKTHALADGPSRLLTKGLDKSHFDDEIPCLPRYSKALLKAEANDTERSVWADPQTVVDTVLLTRRDRLRSPISIDEMLSEQAADEYCQWARRQMDCHTQGTSPFAINQHGVLTRKSKLDNSLQVVVPLSLRKRLLEIAHCAPTSGHPGRAKLYQTMRRGFYWPSMTVDIHHMVTNCTACAKNRMKEQRNVYPMRLFPATKPLEYVAMDILGPLPRTRHGMRFILVVTDRFTKLTKTEPLRTITSLAVAKAFCKAWVFNYGTPKVLLTDNGTQFTATFFRCVCRILGIHKAFTTEYHPQTNGQAERFNRTIIAAIRNYVSDSQRDWDEWLGPLTYAYNTQVHRSTGTTPFDLVLSRHPPPLFVEQDMLEHRPHEHARDRRARLSQAKLEFLHRLSDVMAKARTNLAKTQRRYKKNFDARIRARLKDLQPGSFVYREVPVHPEGVNPKLASPVDGPFRVIANDWPTIVIDDHGRAVRVNANRLVKAPTPIDNRLSESASLPEDAANGGEDGDVDGEDAIGFPQRDANRPSASQPPTSEATADLFQPPPDQVAPPATDARPATQQPVIPQDVASPSATASGLFRPSAGCPPLALPSRDSSPSTSASHHKVASQSPDKAQSQSEDIRERRKPNREFRRQSRRKAAHDQRRYEIGGLVDAGIDDNGNELYKVRWAGYGPADDTWEPASNLPSALVREYKRTHVLG